MLAKMKTDLVERYRNCAELAHADGSNELDYLESKGDYETTNFLESISGKEVELVFTGGDAFEREDNNIWLPDSLWDPA